jgi:hypothetical protein
MKTRYVIILPLLCISTAMVAQDNIKHNHAEDSTDVFFRHLNLNEVTVTGVTGDTKLKHATAPVSIVTPQVLKAKVINYLGGPVACYGYMHGDKLLTPEQQACIQEFFNELGYTNTIVFEGYSIMYDFSGEVTDEVSKVDNREE